MSTVLANTITAVGGGGSTLKMANDATYVSDGGAVTQNTVQGLLKCWIHFPANLASISDSFNVASLTDSGTGDGAVNITNDMSAVNYAITNCVQDGGSDSSLRYIDVTEGTQAAGSYGFESIFVNASDSRTNSDCIGYSMVAGDLA